MCASKYVFNFISPCCNRHKVISHVCDRFRNDNFVKECNHVRTYMEGGEQREGGKEGNKGDALHPCEGHVTVNTCVICVCIRFGGVFCVTKNFTRFRNLPFT